MKKIKKIISENSDFLTIGLIIGGILVTFYLIAFKLEQKDKTLVNIISIFGTMASVFGLAIAFIQIIALKEITEVTQQTISDTKNKLLLGISISDVGETIKLVQEVDSYLGNQKYEIARLKIIDLREKLIQFQSSQEFATIVKEEKINKIVDLLSIQISNLYNAVYSDIGIKFESTELNSELQEIAKYLIAFKNKIKYQTV